MFIFLLFVACTDAQIQKNMSIGSSAHITCWSGGTVIYDGRSTGKIAWLDGGGAYWKDQETGRLTETFADCIFQLE